MSFSSKHIRDSGLLELYVIGTLSIDDMILVENAIKQDESLKREAEAIELDLEKYALAHSETPSSGIWLNMINTLNSNQIQKPKSKIYSNLLYNNISFWIFILTSTFITYMLYTSVTLRQSLEKLQIEFSEYKAECEEQKTKQKENLIQYAKVVSPFTRVINIDPTDNYAETKLSMHIHSKTEENFLQIKNLPEISLMQSYQLWSLIEGKDPRPLDVFYKSSNVLFPVSSIVGTQAYAITIEPRGGQNTPSLDKLIGVFPM